MRPSGFRYSSARRGPSPPSPAVIAAVAVFALLVLLVVFRSRPEPEVTPAPPTPTSPTPSPTVTPTSTATISAVHEFSSDWVEVSTPNDTPTPWPTIPDPVRREPTPTPKVSECVSFRWTTTQVFTPSAQVLTEIRADNGCNRDLEPTDLMFEVSGWREGGLIRSVRAMPFNPIRRRHSDIITVGVPGSLDWYDEVRVEIVD
jgi:hypothetical protein